MSFSPREANYYHIGISVGVPSLKIVSVSVEGILDELLVYRNFARYYDGGYNDILAQEVVAFLNTYDGNVYLKSHHEHGVISSMISKQTTLFAYNLGHVADLRTLFQVVSYRTYRNPGKVMFDRGYPFQVNDYAFDFDNNSFKCQTSGIYVFHISSKADASKSMNISLNGMSRSYGLVRESNTHNSDEVISRTIVGHCTSGQEVSMEFHGGKIDGFLMVIGFHYEPQHALKIAFAAYRNLSMSWSRNEEKILSFNVIEQGVDFSNDFDGVKFLVPEKGYFYIYFGAAVEEGATFKLSLIHTSEETEHELAAVTGDLRANNGFDSIGRGLIVELNSGDTLHIMTTSFSIELYADAGGHHISFIGYMLYRF